MPVPTNDVKLIVIIQAKAAFMPLLPIIRCLPCLLQYLVFLPSHPTLFWESLESDPSAPYSFSTLIYFPQRIRNYTHVHIIFLIPGRRCNY